MLTFCVFRIVFVFVFEEEKEVGMPVQEAVLHVYQAGKLTVVGFGGREIIDQVGIAGCRDEIRTLTEEHACEAFAFDLTGVNLVPSGLLASLQQTGIEVHLFNPSRNVCDSLEVTRLSELMHVHQIDL